MYFKSTVKKTKTKTRTKCQKSQEDPHSSYASHIIYIIFIILITVVVRVWYGEIFHEANSFSQSEEVSENKAWEWNILPHHSDECNKWFIQP